MTLSGQQLAAGDPAVLACIELLESFGAQVTVTEDRREQRAGYDLWVQPPSLGELPYSVQCKNDEKSAATGNVFLEVETEDGDGTVYPSAVATCHADRIMYLLPGRGILCSTPALLCAHGPSLAFRKACSPWNAEAGRRWRARGWLVRADRLVGSQACLSWFPQESR